MAIDFRRKNIRLKGYDYSQNGAYFITVCTKDKHYLFWKNNLCAGTAHPHPELSDTGNVVDIAINNIHEKYPAIFVDKYVIMPNHIHMILLTQAGDSQSINNGRPMAAPTMSTVINQMKGFVSKTVGDAVWQKLFYDRIIRSEAEYREVWEYIDVNPLKWQEDYYYTRDIG